MAGKSSCTRDNRTQDGASRAAVASLRRATDRNDKARVSRPGPILEHRRSRDETAGVSDFYNHHRTHSGLEGCVPVPTTEGSAPPTGLHKYEWRRHCRGLYETPVAA